MMSKTSDLIDRQAAIKAVHEEFDECTVWDESGETTADEVERILDRVPSAQPEVLACGKGELNVSDTNVKDIIRRQDAIEAILDLTDFVSVIELFEHVEEYDLQDKRSGGIIDAIDAVLLLPSAQPERKTGRWEFQGDRMYLCTCCCYLASQEQLKSWRVKKTDSAFPLFCPNCGADMRGDLDE